MKRRRQLTPEERVAKEFCLLDVVNYEELRGKRAWSDWTDHSTAQRLIARGWVVQVDRLWPEGMSMPPALGLRLTQSGQAALLAHLREKLTRPDLTEEQRRAWEKCIADTEAMARRAGIDVRQLGGGA